MPDSPTETLAEERIGRSLNDKWRLDSLLGVGGTAAVYAATHRNGSRVAIKILHAAISASDEARIRFKREGYIVNRIEHPGVVRVLDDDIDETDGAAFIVMDRADGVSLCERVQRRLLDEREVLEVTAQLLEILAAAHEKGVIHRDLKPDNLLVDEAGRVRLLDFGIARLLDDDSNLTRTGFTFGTPAYMAPEQAMGRKAQIGARTDVYAVGATMFTLLSGEYVQVADNAQELLIKIATRPARSLAEVRPESSPELVQIVDCATKMLLDDRFASAEAMLARVREVMKARGIDASRRRISSRISRVSIPGDTNADEQEEEIFELKREPGADRSSVIRGRHSIADNITQEAPKAVPAVAMTPAAMVSAPTRPSLVRVNRRHARRSWLMAGAAALALVTVTMITIGWNRAPKSENTPVASAAGHAANEEPTVVSSPVAIVESTAKPEVQAPQMQVMAPPSASVQNVAAPTVAPLGIGKPGKVPRRKIDVGY